MAKQECVQPSKDLDTILHKKTNVTSANGEYKLRNWILLLVLVLIGKLQMFWLKRINNKNVG
jgi:hypothetical protein